MTLSPEEWEVIALSLKVSGVAVLACLPVAFALDRKSTRLNSSH